MSTPGQDFLRNGTLEVGASLLPRVASAPGCLLRRSKFPKPGRQPRPRTSRTVGATRPSLRWRGARCGDDENGPVRLTTLATGDLVWLAGCTHALPACEAVVERLRELCRCILKRHLCMLASAEKDRVRQACLNSRSSHAVLVSVRTHFQDARCPEGVGGTVA